MCVSDSWEDQVVGTLGVSEELVPKRKRRNDPVTLCHLRQAFMLLCYGNPSFGRQFFCIHGYCWSFEGPRDPSPTSRILYRDNTRPRQSFFRHATLGSKTPNFQDPAPSDILRVF